MNISNRIKKLRESNGFSRDEFAKGVVSYSHLSNIESGRFEPSEDILIALARKLDVPKDYLLKYDEHDPKLAEKLSLLKNYIDNLELEKANVVLKEIKQQYNIINSVKLETFFYLLEAYYLFKVYDDVNGGKIFTNEVEPLFDNTDIDSLLTEYQEVYYYLKGIINFFKGDFKVSYEYFVKNYSLVKTNILKAIANHNLALTLLRMNNILMAFTYAETALDLSLKERHWAEVADADILLGVLYLENGDPKNAEKYFFRALEIIDKYNKVEKLKPVIYHNLGVVYEKSNFDKSLEFFSKSLETKKQLKLVHNLIITYRSIIELYIKHNLVDKALSVHNEAEQHYTNETDKNHLKALKAEIHLKLNENEAYEAYMKEALEYFSKNKLWRYVIINGEKLSEHYLSVKKYKQAANFLKLVVQANKTFYGRDSY